MRLIAISVLLALYLTAPVEAQDATPTPATTPPPGPGITAASDLLAAQIGKCTVELALVTEHATRLAAENKELHRVLDATRKELDNLKNTTAK